MHEPRYVVRSTRGWRIYSTAKAVNSTVLEGLTVMVLDSWLCYRVADEWRSEDYVGERTMLGRAAALAAAEQRCAELNARVERAA